VIAWLNPAAAAGLAAVALPLLIHLLLRQRARRIVVPSVRFILPSTESSVRLRTPSDVLLLAVRAGIVALAATALMQPLLVTAARRSTWASRVVRAIVVDTSESVDAAAVRAAADAEARDAFAVRRFESPDPAEAMALAVAWLKNSGPGRRELVVLSDFQLGAISSAQVDRVPQVIGMRMAKIAGTNPALPGLEAGKVIHGGARMAQHAELAGNETAVTLIAAAAGFEGLEVLAGDQQPGAVERLVDTVGRAGAVAPATDEPIVVRFAGAPPHDRPEQAFSPWARAASMRLLLAPGLQDLSPRVSQRGGALVVDVDVDADSWRAAAVLQAALNARRDERAWQEREPLKVSDDELAAWTRSAPDPTSDAWKHGDQSDGRWFWFVALVLMGAEVGLRRSAPANRGAEVARAA
jgi:hypothetical protein